MFRKFRKHSARATVLLLITAAQTAAYADSLAPRRGQIVVWVSDEQREPAAGVHVQVRQIRHEFLFGATLPLELPATEEAATTAVPLLELFLRYFNAVATGNTLSWTRMPSPSTTRWPAVEPLVAWARDHAVHVHVQRVFSGDDVPLWAQGLVPAQCLEAVHACAASLAQNFRVQVASYEAAGDLLETAPCGDALNMAERALETMGNEDPDARLFMWDSKVIGNDERTRQWVEMIKTLIARGAPIHGLAVPIGFVDQVSPEALKPCLDLLARIELPVYLTDMAIAGEPGADAASQLSDWLIAAFAHPVVQGIFFADPRTLDNLTSAKLIAPNGTLTAAGRVYESLVFQTWKSAADGVTDSLGRFECEGYFGEYEISATRDNGSSAVILTKLQRSLGREIVSLHLPPSVQTAPTNQKSIQEKSKPESTVNEDISLPVRP